MGKLILASPIADHCLTALTSAKLFLTINSRPRPHIIATMASKFMANAAFEARLLLRPSHQRTVWTVNKLPKPSRSTEGSQSSGPEDKKWFDPNARVKSVGALAAG